MLKDISRKTVELDIKEWDSSFYAKEPSVIVMFEYIKQAEEADKNPGDLSKQLELFDSLLKGYIAKSVFTDKELTKSVDTDDLDPELELLLAMECLKMFGDVVKRVENVLPQKGETSKEG